jgi:hypothetical protein
VAAVDLEILLLPYAKAIVVSGCLETKEAILGRCRHEAYRYGATTRV